MTITQQHECYAAEQTLDAGRSFASVAEVQAFVDSLRDERWWALQRYPLYVLRIEVGKADGRKLRNASGVAWFEKEKNAGRIELKPSGMCMRVVLHEVAHVLACAVHGSKSHDPWWAKTYLTLVSYVMGTDAYLQLQRAFDALGVDYQVDTAPVGAIAL